MDFATTADLRLDPLQNKASPSILHYDRIPLSDWIAVLIAADVIGAISIAAIVYGLYVNPFNYEDGQLLAGLGSFLVGWIVASWTHSLYSRKILLGGAWTHIQHGIAACALAFCVVLLLGFALKFIGGVSRVWLLTWAMSSFVWLTGLRLLWTYCLRRSLRLGKCLDRALVLVGPHGHARHVGDAIERESQGQIAVVAAMGIPGTPGGASIDWLDDVIREGMVDRVVIANVDGATEPSRKLLARLTRVAVDVAVIPDIAHLQAPMLGVHRIGPLPAIDIAYRPLSAVEIALKRAEDLVLGCLVLLMVAPLFVIIAITIKLDSRGPVLFGQMREGYHNKPFKVWKFRTMFHSARDERAVQQTSRNDRRVTRVGRILRRFSLDELPQVINVIQGQMSIVGPRPHALGMTSVGLPMTEVLEGYGARLRLKPGITGWAQVNGCRGEVDSHDKLRRRVALDCHYIDNWSLSLDLWIILRTSALLLFDASAY